MCKLGQRVVLIHELGQLGTSKEFLYSSCNRLDIDQGLWCNAVYILSCHTFSYNTLHTG